MLTTTNLDYNDDLQGFIATTATGKTVQIQFDIERNRLHADFNKHYAVIDKENEYGLDLTEQEEENFKDWMKKNKQIQLKALELDELVEHDQSN